MIPDIKDIKEMAKQGDPIQQWNLGYCYRRGDLVSQDYNKAIYWLSKAAEQGHVDSISELCTMYRYKKFSYDMAVYWYRKGVEFGVRRAKEELEYLLSKSKEHENNLKNIPYNQENGI